MGNFIKTTAIGGLLFLVPIVVLAVIPKKAYNIMMLVAVPLDRLIPIETIGGVALPEDSWKGLFHRWATR